MAQLVLYLVSHMEEIKLPEARASFWRTWVRVGANSSKLLQNPIPCESGSLSQFPTLTYMPCHVAPSISTQQWGIDFFLALNISDFPFHFFQGKKVLCL